MKNFKDLYDEDQLRAQPLGDVLDAKLGLEYLGIDVPDPLNGNALTTIGVTLSQLKDGIDQPALIISGSPGVQTPDAVDGLHLLQTESIPAGFVKTGSVMYIETYWDKERTGTQANVIVRVPNTLGGFEDVINVALNLSAASFFYRRTQMGFTTVSAAGVPDETETQSYGEFTSQSAVVLASGEWLDGFDIEFYGEHTGDTRIRLKNYTMMLLTG